jgi:hypothetical protein
MQHIAYTLSMPSVNTWNGKWSGQDNLYCRVRNYTNKSGNAARALAQTSYQHNFGDGWVARVAVTPIADPKAVKDLVKRSAGFCGYEWMIDSIEKYGEIRAD